MSSDLGLDTWNSTAGYIGIRAQLRNPINRKLPRSKTQVAGASEERSGYPRLRFYFFFSFLFFIFFLFLSFIYVVLEQIVPVRIFFFF